MSRPRSLLLALLFFILNFAAAEPSPLESKLKSWAGPPQPAALVFIEYLKGCPVWRKYQPSLAELHRRFGNRVRFINLNSGAPAGSGGVRRDLAAFHNVFPLLQDSDQSATKLLGLRTAAEVAVVSTRSWQVVYRGAIDDSVTFDYQAPRPDRAYLQDVLTRLTGGEDVAFTSTAAYGCAIHLTE